MLANASAGGDWTIYSEPEVGLPPSLFAGRPGQSGFDQIEPLRGVDLDLAAEGISALPALLDFIEQRAASVDTRPKDEDALAASLASGAARSEAKGDAQ